MDLKVTINDVVDLQHYLNTDCGLKYHLSLEKEGVFWDFVVPVVPVVPLDTHDTGFYYRAVFKLMHNPPKPLLPAGYGFIDKNLANFDNAREFGSFGVDLWLKPSSASKPQLFTCSLIVLFD